MPTARKRGDSWRVRKYIYTDDQGNKHYKSFTAPTKDMAEQLAREYVGGIKNNTNLRLTDAMSEYIESKSSVLSPRTISSYKSIQKNYLKSIIHKNIYRITQLDIQKAINIEAASLSPHTIRNIHGFLTVVISVYRPGFVIKTTLPKKTRPNLTIPDEDDIERLMSAVEGTNLELPVLLAAFGPMRRGEICALRAEDINGNVVHVCRNVVKSNDKNNPWIEKAPKSYAGDREIPYPDFVREVWEATGITSGRLVTICPDTITKKFAITLEQNHIKPFRFHDLRHFAASIMHARGGGKVFIRKRGGWEPGSEIRYSHSLKSAEEIQNNMINEYFENRFGNREV